MWRPTGPYSGVYETDVNRTVMKCELPCIAPDNDDITILRFCCMFSMIHQGICVTKEGKILRNKQISGIDNKI